MSEVRTKKIQMARQRRTLVSARKHYLKRMRRYRYRRQRCAAAALLGCAVVYLSILNGANERILSVKEEYTAEIVFPAAEAGRQERFRVVLRLKTGEIFFLHEEILREDFHEETAVIHNAVP